MKVEIVWVRGRLVRGREDMQASLQSHGQTVKMLACQ